MSDNNVVTNELALPCDFANPSALVAGQIYSVRLEDIFVDPGFNCRGEIDPQSVWDLAESIKSNGLQQAVIVRLLNPGEYARIGKPVQLVAGFRRYKAHKLLEMTTIRAELRKDMTAKEAAVINLAENLTRKDLNIMQEARALQNLVHLGFDRAEIGKRFGHGEGWVQVRIMLLQFSPRLQEFAAAGLLNYLDIRDLNSFTDLNEREAAAIELVERKKSGEKVKVKKASKTKKDKSHIARRRDAQEILALQEYMNTRKVPFGFHNRCLAWAAGNISDTELLYDMKTYVENHPDWDGNHWAVPMNGLPDLRNLKPEDTGALLKERFMSEMSDESSIEDTTPLSDNSVTSDILSDSE